MDKNYSKENDPVFNLQKRSTLINNSSDNDLMQLFVDAHANGYAFVVSGDYHSYYNDIKKEIISRMDSGRHETCKHCISSGPEECKVCSNRSSETRYARN